MCEVFGISSKNRFTINDYLKKFYERSNKHPHGWGLACLDGTEALIEKEPMQASKSYYLKERLSSDISVKHAMAHIRYATIGNVEYINCHPYTKKDRNGRRWTLVHNGTIFDYAPLDKYVGIQTGSTDSERILLYLVDQIDQAERQAERRLDAKERFQILDSIFVAMSAGNKLNMIIYDGECMYVHTNYKKSLHFLEKEEGTMFATAPLTREGWIPLPMNTLLAYQDGRRIYTGTNHGNEYIDSEENMKFLDQIFSNL